MTLPVSLCTKTAFVGTWANFLSLSLGLYERGEDKRTHWICSKVATTFKTWQRQRSWSWNLCVEVASILSTAFLRLSGCFSPGNECDCFVLNGGRLLGLDVDSAESLSLVRLQQLLCGWHLAVVDFCKAAFASGTTYSLPDPWGCCSRLLSSISSAVLPQLPGFSCYPGTCAVLQTNHGHHSLTQL